MFSLEAIVEAPSDPLLHHISKLHVWKLSASRDYFEWFVYLSLMMRFDFITFFTHHLSLGYQEIDPGSLVEEVRLLSLLIRYEFGVQLLVRQQKIESQPLGSTLKAALLDWYALVSASQAGVKQVVNLAGRSGLWVIRVQGVENADNSISLFVGRKGVLSSGETLDRGCILMPGER